LCKSIKTGKNPLIFRRKKSFFGVLKNFEREKNSRKNKKRLFEEKFEKFTISNKVKR